MTYLSLIHYDIKYKKENKHENTNLNIWHGQRVLANWKKKLAQKISNDEFRLQTTFHAETCVMPH